MKSLPLFYFTCFVFIANFVSCFSQENTTSINLLTTKQDGSLNNWFQKDYLQDGIPGISLNKWYGQNTTKQKKKDIIVAVIDTQIDLKHEDLLGQIWTNTKEINNNGIDDDNNGYVDDVNGWNFAGTKSGGFIVWGNFEFVRIIREWNSRFKDKKENQIASNELYDYREYQRALQLFETRNADYKNWLENQKYSILTYPIARDSLKHYFPKEDYTYKQLDSLYNKYKINDKTYRQRREDKDYDIGAMVGFLKRKFELNENTLEDIIETKIQVDSIVNKNLNLNFNEREALGDNAYDLQKGYGNNLVSNNKVGHRKIQDHCTKVSGIIAANRNNDFGINGISEMVKIMPLNISYSGDEHDKDIAMAIYYAVDNGAKVINMSFGKEFSLHKKWVIDAYKYAEKHNVLLVHAAGNNSFNVDENPYYPSDVDYENPDEVVENFITVGSISQKIDSNFVSEFSNYGKKNVDLFAPGDKIYTTTPGNSYAYDSGTSLAAPMVSGTAALIWSYYPKLTAKEVKQIILESGTEYDIEVLIPGGEGKKAKFSELSKSGRVLNAYNAMQLAEKKTRRK